MLLEVVMSRKRKKKKISIIFLFILFFILIGGFILMIMNNNKKKTVENKANIKEEEVTKEMEKAPDNSSSYDSLPDGEYVTSKVFILKKENGISYVDGNMIVNKTYSLPKTFVPINPYNGDSTSPWCINCIDKDVMEAFKIMQSDAKSLGLNIYISSGYRGYDRQVTLYNNYVDRDGVEAADRYSARAGHSEHQSGLCFDLNSIDDSFTNTNEGKWVNNNAHLYGFIIRFPKGLEDETGYQYESWHLRYVGKELATKLYNDGNWLSLEGYYGLSSVY